MSKNYTVSETAQKLGKSTKTIRRWIQNGHLHAIKQGHEWRISGETIKHIIVHGLDKNLEHIPSQSSHHNAQHRVNTRLAPKHQTSNTLPMNTTKRARGTGSLRKTKNGTYLATIRVNEKQHRKRFTNLAEAHHWLDYHYENRSRPTDVTTLRDLYEEWRKTWDVTMQTEKTYVAWSNYWLDLYGDEELASINRSRARTIWQRIARDNTTYTGRHIQKRLRACYLWGMREELVPRNPFDGLKTIRLQQKLGKNRALSNEDYARLHHHLLTNRCDTQNHPCACHARFLLGLRLGLRQGEVHALKWSCVVLDSDAPYIIVERTQQYDDKGSPSVKETTKTGPGGEGIVPLDDELADYLQEHKQVSPSSVWVFPARDDVTQPMTKYGDRRAWTRLKQEAGIATHHRVHDLRHTAATRLAAHNLTAAQNILRHSDIATTAQYVHPNMSTLRDALRDAR